MAVYELGGVKKRPWWDLFLESCGGGVGFGGGPSLLGGSPAAAPEATRVPTLQDVPQREPTASERAFFRSRSDVTGMATDDDAVILNPFSTLKPEQKEAVLLNERARVHMRRSKNRPAFALTSEQCIQFKDYSQNEQDIRETVAARILSGDPSAGNVTQEQRGWVQANLQTASQASEEERVARLKGKYLGRVTNPAGAAKRKKMLLGGGVSGPYILGADDPRRKVAWRAY